MPATDAGKDRGRDPRPRCPPGNPLIGLAQQFGEARGAGRLCARRSAPRPTPTTSTTPTSKRHFRGVDPRLGGVRRLLHACTCAAPTTSSRSSAPGAGRRHSIELSSSMANMLAECGQPHRRTSSSRSAPAPSTTARRSTSPSATSSALVDHRGDRDLHPDRPRRRPRRVDAGVPAPRHLSRRTRRSSPRTRSSLAADTERVEVPPVGNVTIDAPGRLRRRARGETDLRRPERPDPRGEGHQRRGPAAAGPQRTARRWASTPDRTVHPVPSFHSVFRVAAGRPHSGSR